MEVLVSLFGQRVGTLYEDEGIIYFEYASEFIESGLNISPIKLPFDRQTYTNNDDRYFQTLAGVFFDSLPDKFGTKVIERYYESQNLAIKDLTVLQKLVFIGTRGMGALEYEPSEKILYESDLSETFDIRQMYEASRSIIKGETTSTIREMLLFMNSAASAGGARAKAVVGWNRKINRLISGVSQLEDGYEYWLVKFDGYDDNSISTDFTKLEYLYMTMARD